MSDRFEVFRIEAKKFCDSSKTFSYQEAETGIPEFFGELLLTDNNGEVIDAYNIRVVGVEDYPLWFPLVFETGGRIPLNIDWHVHKAGNCCICSFPEEIIICNSGLSLQRFIEGHVKPYFFNQKYRELHGFFLKERAHGNQGNLEYFFEVFKTKNLPLIIKCLQYIKDFDEPDRVKDCFCGSGMKYRKCHRDAFRVLKPLQNGILEWFIKFVKSSTQNMK